MQEIFVLSQRHSARLVATRKKCVTHLLTLELRKSLLWDLHKQALTLLEANCYNDRKATLWVDDGQPELIGGASPETSPVSAGDLLKKLRYHFSEHVRCMQDLACHDLRLAIRNAIKYRRSGLPVEDLIQAANSGLLAASERFDERRGARFATYATWWIRQGIQREIDNFSTLIRIPAHSRGILRELQDRQHEISTDRALPTN